MTRSRARGLDLHDFWHARHLSNLPRPYTNLIREVVSQIIGTGGIAKQIAEALEAAHEAGVIHRDLKPANIKIKGDGTVKVLDFGLAKALDTTPQGDPSLSPTLTAAATQMGVILGTAAYMSPEQARGKTVDRRADIWSFGVVLYEMLTGVRPFRGEDVSLTLASVMKSDVDVKTLPPDLPETLRTVLRRCLEKDPLQRIRDMGDVRLAMEGAFESSPSERTGARQLRQLQVWQRPAPAAVAIFALIVLTAVGVWNLPRSTTPSRLVRFAINTPVGGPLVLQADRTQGTIAFSPDGSRVVYRSGSSSSVNEQAPGPAWRSAPSETLPLRGSAVQDARHVAISASDDGGAYRRPGEGAEVAPWGATRAEETATT